jgi:hypothetical protein
MRLTPVMLVLGCLLLVQGCKSPSSQTPPPQPPPPSSPSSSPPSSPSSPSSPPPSSPSSQSKSSPPKPSQSQQKQSSSKQSSSEQSSSKQSSSEQSSSKQSSSKQSSSSENASQSQQSSSESSSEQSSQPSQPSQPSQQQQGESSQERQQRTQAGTDLQAAGEQVANAADLLGDAESQANNEGSTQPQSDANESGSEPEDPLIPKMEPTDSQSDELVFEESSANDQQTDSDSMQDGAPGQQNDTSDQGDAGTEGVSEADSGSIANASNDPAGSGAESSSDSMNENNSEENAGGGLSDEIAAAQEALEQAGMALQTAGAAVSGAETDSELQLAEDLLADARVGILVAEQQLSDLDGQNGGSGAMGDGDDSTDRASEALSEANMQLVIATQAVLNARTGMPDYEGSELPGGTQVVVVGEVGTLDDELDESLIVFDDQIETARTVMINSSAPPISESTKNRLPGDAGQGLVLVTGDGQESERPPTEGSDQPSIVTSTVPGNKDEQTVASATPDDIPSAQGDDIVAQQLREAAMDETDPELKAKLWEEYKRYKQGL